MKSLDGIMYSETHALSPEKKELLALEAEGKYVFHGGSTKLDVIEPRQAADEGIPDREPAVFGSSVANVGIFYAIYPFKKFPEFLVELGTVLHDDGSVETKFGVPKAVFNSIPEDAVGWVHVCDRKDFHLIENRGGIEYESLKPHTPVKNIRVTKRDLPEHIKILPEPE